MLPDILFSCNKQAYLSLSAYIILRKNRNFN